MIAIGGGDLVLFFASQFYQGLLKKLDIGLQVSGTTLHPRFGRAEATPRMSCAATGDSNVTSGAPAAPPPSNARIIAARPEP